MPKRQIQCLIQGEIRISETNGKLVILVRSISVSAINDLINSVSSLTRSVLHFGEKMQLLTELNESVVWGSVLIIRKYIATLIWVSHFRKIRFKLIITDLNGCPTVFNPTEKLQQSGFSLTKLSVSLCYAWLQMIVKDILIRSGLESSNRLLITVVLGC